MPLGLRIAFGLVAITAALAVGGWALTTAVSQDPRAPSQFAPTQQASPPRVKQPAQGLVGQPGGADEQAAPGTAAEQADATGQDLKRRRDGGAQAVDRDVQVARRQQAEAAAQHARQRQAEAVRANTERLRRAQGQAAAQNAERARSQPSEAGTNSTSRPAPQQSPETESGGDGDRDEGE